MNLFMNAFLIMFTVDTKTLCVLKKTRLGKSFRFKKKKLFDKKNALLSTLQCVMLMRGESRQPASSKDAGVKCLSSIHWQGKKSHLHRF